ncbi:MAG TPA: UDP-N-acetylmuramoyl-tripeptide--D-alanyl-D-alanine ligase, partial [Tenericutes bacterium]|nr:UDP-N-acetylmuramoyl-tripeptide--D-alanyl-D-alanine ligase [Mycoplasmatota bacterium]
MNNLFLLCSFSTFIYLIFKTKKSFHMLQQNWYNEDNRYLKWIFHNRKKVFLHYDLLILILFIFKLFLNNKALIILYSFFYIISSYLFLREVKNEQKKKPLVVTARIKRLSITLSIIYGFVFSYIYFTFNTDYTIGYLVTIGLLIYFNYFVVFCANIINKPIEKQVFYYYKRQAVKRLKNMNNLEVIGITGSYGKTSSKNILSDILNIKYNAFPTPKNFNTTYGLINTINNYLDKFSDIFIAEMGASAKGDIKELCNLVKPKYGILTKIGTAHLESFGSRENIQKGKFELIESLPSDGVAILNKDDEYQVSYKFKNDCKIIWIGIENKDADVIAENITMSNKGMSFDCKFKNDDKRYTFTTRLLGTANIYNILAGIALGYELGISIDELILGVKKVTSVEHRLELKKIGTLNIIDDSYNSNPVGSKMAVEVLGLMPGKKIIV